jgi:hypothetical protein
MEHHVGMHMLVKIHCYNNVWMSSWQVAHQTAAYRRPPTGLGLFAIQQVRRHVQKERRVLMK